MNAANRDGRVAVGALKEQRVHISCWCGIHHKLEFPRERKRAQLSERTGQRAGSPVESLKDFAIRFGNSGVGVRITFALRCNHSAMPGQASRTLRTCEMLADTRDFPAFRL